MCDAPIQAAAVWPTSGHVTPDCCLHTDFTTQLSSRTSTALVDCWATLSSPVVNKTLSAAGTDRQQGLMGDVSVCLYSEH